MAPQAPSQVLKTNFRWELVGGPKLKIALLVVNCLALIESHLRSPLLFSHLSCQLNFLPVLWKQNFNFGLSRDLRWRECTKVFLTYFIGLTCKCNRWWQQQQRQQRQQWSSDHFRTRRYFSKNSLLFQNRYLQRDKGCFLV